MECESGWERSFIGATRHLLDAIAEGSEPMLTLAQGRDILAGALAAQNSAVADSAVAVDVSIGATAAMVRHRLRGVPIR